MSRCDYYTGYKMFTDGLSFDVNVDAVPSDYNLITLPDIYGTMFTVYEETPAPKGRKPRRGVKSSDGKVLVEVSGTQQAAHNILGRFIGQTFSKCFIEDSYYDNKGIVRLNLSDTERPNRYRRLVLDTETTGLDPNSDEILQLSIIDNEGNTIWNKLYKPERVVEWSEAAAINGITADMVAAAPSISSDIEEIQKVLDSCNELVIFNAEFDAAFLGVAGFRFSGREANIVDAMKEYGTFTGKGLYCKLTDAAAEIGFKYHAHDALEDVKATLAVIKHVDRLKQRYSSSAIFEQPVAKQPVQAKRDSKPKEGKKLRIPFVVVAVIAFFFALCFALNIPGYVGAGDIASAVIAAVLTVICGGFGYLMVKKATKK